MCVISAPRVSPPSSASISNVAHQEVRDVHQRLGGPLEEPVDRAAVDQRRELLRARAELVADGREAEDDVEVGGGRAR